jgi:hypothetical protein
MMLKLENFISISTDSVKNISTSVFHALKYFLYWLNLHGKMYWDNYDQTKQKG